MLDFTFRHELGDQRLDRSRITKLDSGLVAHGAEISISELAGRNRSHCSGVLLGQLGIGSTECSELIVFGWRLFSRGSIDDRCSLARRRFRFASALGGHGSVLDRKTRLRIRPDSPRLHAPETLLGLSPRRCVQIGRPSMAVRVEFSVVRRDRAKRRIFDGLRTSFVQSSLNVERLDIMIGQVVRDSEPREGARVGACKSTQVNKNFVGTLTGNFDLDRHFTFPFRPKRDGSRSIFPVLSPEFFRRSSQGRQKSPQ